MNVKCLENGDKISELPEDLLSDAIMVFNVGGTKFETTLSTLQKEPGTRLAQYDCIMEYYRPDTGEYFLDRDLDVFKAVLNFYRMGELHVPMGVCGQVFQRELEFWGIDENKIEQCCWGSYHEFKQKKEILTKMHKALKSSVQDMRKPIKSSKWKEFKRQGWVFLEDPFSSRGALVYTSISTIFVLLSIGAFCLETMPQLQHNMTNTDWAIYQGLKVSDLYDYDDSGDYDTGGPDSGDSVDGGSSSGDDKHDTNETTHDGSGTQTSSSLDLNDNTSIPPSPPKRSPPRPKRNIPKGPSPAPKGTPPPTKMLKKSFTTPTTPTNGRDFRRKHVVFEYIDIICLVFFTFDFSFRLFFAPKKLSFLRQPLTIFEAISLFGFYANVAVVLFEPKQQYLTNEVDVVFAIFHIFRIFPIFRTLSAYKGALVLAYTFKTSIKEIGLMIVFLSISVLIFGTLMYFVDSNEKFPSIPISFWWALVTITTVGYGDMFPTTSLGYVVGSFCAVSGVLVIAFTVPIVVGNFMLYYGHSQSRPEEVDVINDGSETELQTEEKRAMASTNMRRFSLSVSSSGQKMFSSRHRTKVRSMSVSVEPIMQESESHDKYSTSQVKY